MITRTLHIGARVRFENHEGEITENHGGNLYTVRFSDCTKKIHSSWLDEIDPNTKLEAIITQFENAAAVKSTWRRRPIPRPCDFPVVAMFESIAPPDYTLTIFENGTFETDLGTADILPALTTACKELESLFYTTNPSETSHE